MGAAKKKIAIITTVWLRPEVYRMFRVITNDMISKVDESIEVKVFVAGSEGDISRIPTISDGFEYIEVPNKPLGRKWNSALKSSREWNPDFVIFMGSDDVMDLDLFNEYVKRMDGKESPHYVGVYDWYFYDIRSNSCLYWAGYDKDANRGHFCGAGRAMNRAMLDSLDWECWLDEKLDHLLDTSMDRKIGKIDFTQEGFYVKDVGMGVDIKSDVNMTKFAIWNNTFPIDKKEILDKIPLIDDVINGYA